MRSLSVMSCRLSVSLALAVALVGSGCARATIPPTVRPAAGGAYVAPARETAFLDTLSRRTFDFFWETTNPRNGLTPDRWPTKSFSSVAAVGFALTAYPIGIEHG